MNDGCLAMDLSSPLKNRTLWMVSFYLTKWMFIQVVSTLNFRQFFWLISTCFHNKYNFPYFSICLRVKITKQDPNAGKLDKTWSMNLNKIEDVLMWCHHVFQAPMLPIFCQNTYLTASVTESGRKAPFWGRTLSPVKSKEIDTKVRMELPLVCCPLALVWTNL